MTKTEPNWTNLREAASQTDAAPSTLPQQSLEVQRWLAAISGWHTSGASADADIGNWAVRGAAANAAPSALDATTRDAVPVIGQLVRRIAGMAEPEEPQYCEFTLEFVQLGSIDGRVLVNGDSAQVTLQPRRRDVALFLHEQRNEIERRASRQSGLSIRLAILGRA